MPSLAGRIVILTGPSSGIGYETLRQLVLSSAHVYLFGRNLKKLERTRQTILSECTQSLGECSKGSLRYHGSVGQMDLIQCDLGSLTSIQKAVTQFKEREERVDLVFANAGVMQQGKTDDGYEVMWGTNVLGHHALLRLLLPLLQKSARHLDSIHTGATRVVLTASDTHRWVNSPTHLALPTLQDASSSGLGHIHLYGRSKLGNIYTASKLSDLSTQEQWGITVCSVHPGGVKSQLGSSNRTLTRIKNWFLVPATLGAVTQLWGGTGAEKEVVHGKYLVPWARVGEQSDLAKDTKTRDDVWGWCEHECVRHGIIAEDQVIL